MKRCIILFGILSVILLACSFKDKSISEESGSTGVDFQNLTLAEGKELARQQNKLILIDFFSPG